MLLCRYAHLDEVVILIRRLGLQFAFLFLSVLSVAASENKGTADRQNDEAFHG
jgi:hypothetical protein